MECLPVKPSQVFAEQLQGKETEGLPAIFRGALLSLLQNFYRMQTDSMSVGEWLRASPVPSGLTATRFSIRMPNSPGR